MKARINTTKRLLLGSAIILIMGVTNSCTKTMDYSTTTGGTKGGSNTPGTNEVWMQGLAFTPATVTITAGSTIKWTNKDNVGHTVTSDAGLFDSGVIGLNGTFSFTFATAGTYTYHCTPHPFMTATIIVQ